MKKTVKNYIIAGIVDIVLLAAFAWLRGIFDVLDTEHVCHILSDDFFAIGILNLSLGLLIWLSNEGTFDILNYGMRSFWGFFFKKLNKYADFEDYKTEKHSVQVSFLHFVIYGVIFIVVAYIFLKNYQLACQ